MKSRNRRLPPLKSLLVLESVVRTGSVTAAANELSVTHSAVSKQLSVLEAWLQVPLFDSSRRKMIPTENIAHLAGIIGDAFDDIQQALGRIDAPQAAPPAIKILASATLAMRWLIPRLPQFHQYDNPIDITVHPLHSKDKWQDVPFDIVIRRNGEDVPGFERSLLFREKLSLVMSAQRYEGLKGEISEGINQVDLIDVSTRPGELKAWLRAAGITTGREKKAIKLPHFYLALDAMMAGQGALVAPTFITEALCRKGEIVDVLPACRIEGASWHIITHPEASQKALTQQFTVWLKSILPE